MMIRNNLVIKKILLSLLLMLGIFFVASASSVSNIYAAPVSPDETNSDTNGGASGDKTVRLETSAFYTGAIKSLDQETAKKEETQDYIVNFANSSVTALPYSLSLVDPDTIGMFVVGIIIDIIEKMGSAVSLIVMIFYNFTSSTFWSTSMNAIFDTFDKAFFDWNNPNSWFYRVIFLFGAIAVIKKLFGNIKRTLTIKSSITIVLQVVMSCMLIVFIGQNGRNIVKYVENIANQSINQSFNFLNSNYDNNLPLEVNVKNQLFDVTQKQGFILRHFGVTDVDQIPNKYENTYKGENYDVSVTSEERVKTLLNNPTTDNAEVERKTYGNDQIGYSTEQCFAILGQSFIFLIHRCLIGFILASACAMLFIFIIMKEITIALSVYGLVFQLFKNELRVASTWFFARLKWSIMFIAVNLIFNMFLSFIITMINVLTSRSLLFLLPFDVVLIFGILYIKNNYKDIWEKITSDLGISSDSSIIDAGKAIINGEVSPVDVMNNRKDRLEREALSLEGENDESDSTSSVGNDNDELADVDDTSLSDVDSLDESDQLSDADEEDEINIDDELTDENEEDITLENPDIDIENADIEIQEGDSSTDDGDVSDNLDDVNIEETNSISDIEDLEEDIDLDKELQNENNQLDDVDSSVQIDDNDDLSDIDLEDDTKQINDDADSSVQIDDNDDLSDVDLEDDSKQVNDDINSSEQLNTNDDLGDADTEERNKQSRDNDALSDIDTEEKNKQSDPKSIDVVDDENSTQVDKPKENVKDEVLSKKDMEEMDNFLDEVLDESTKDEIVLEEEANND